MTKDCLWIALSGARVLENRGPEALVGRKYCEASNGQDLLLERTPAKGAVIAIW